MTFYNNKAIIQEFDKENLYMFQNIKNEIIMNHFDYKSNINKKETISKDCNGEYDITLMDNSLYLIYQNLLKNLNLVIIKGKNISNIPITEEPIDRIYELNIFNNNNQLNIIYLRSLTTGEKDYRIIHNYIDGDEWVSNNIIDIKIDQAINPIKIIKKGENYILCFYNGNDLCIKELNSGDSQWDETIILTKTNNKRLYFDLLRIEDSLHLVYSQYQNNNYVVIYERYNYVDGNVIKDFEQEISNESNCTNPTLILYENSIWIAWNESNRLYSKFSEDNGRSWSPIYYWKESISKDLVRYKYLKEYDDEDFKFDFSFGTLSPEIKFVGFGPLENVEEVNSKKKVEYGIIETSNNNIVDKNIKDNNIEDKNLKSPETVNIIDDLDEKIDSLEKDIKISMNKIRFIEEFLIKNTRGHFEKAMKKESD